MQILHRLGGVYVDVDYECLRPLSSFLRRCAFSGLERCTFLCGLSHTSLGAAEVNNGFMG